MSYRDNLDAYFELDKQVVSKRLNEKEAIDALTSIAMQKRKIQEDNNKIINEIIVPFENTGVIPTAEDVVRLKEVYESLFQPPNYYDRGILRRITRILLRYNVCNDDWNKAVKDLYLLAYYSFIESDHGDMHLKPELTDQSNHIMQMYDSLSDEGKDNAITYIMACVYDPSDINGALNRFRNVKYYLDKYKIDISDQNTQAGRGYLACLTDTLNQVNEAWCQGSICFDGDDLELLNFIYDETMRAMAEPHYFMQTVACDQALLETGLILGRHTVEEACAKLDKMLYDKSSKNEIDQSAMLFLPAATYIRFIWNYSTFPEEKKIKKSEKLLALTEKRYGRIKKKKDNYYQLSYVAQFIMSAAKNLGFERTKDYVFNLTVYADKALYIHTMMVAKISNVILKKIIEISPEWLDGVAGMSTEEIKNKPAKMLKLMDECALFHDIGKHFCIDYVSNSSRNLTDDEFNAIKYHPSNFERFYDQIEGDEKYKCIRDAAMLHHLWYNNEGGYPKYKHTCNRPLVSIISIADSIDAATDVVGRPYAPGKTLDELIGEFDSYRDTRYSGFVTDIIKDEDVKSEIERLITEERRHLNYQIMTR